MYLDIQMPDVTGIDYLKTIKNPPVIIFTTAYPQFALTAFELDAVDYLIKPISFERFLKATNKAKELVDLRNLKDSNMLVKGKDHFYIKSDKKIVRVNFDEILFVEGMAHHLIIHTGNKKYITYLTFKALDDFLPKDKFIKTHKSYLIALSKIENIEADEITISGKTLPISRSYKEDIMKLIDDRFLRR
jgi:DNA-binding LytR/AlgR family response regulator